MIVRVGGGLEFPYGEEVLTDFGRAACERESQTSVTCGQAD